MEVYTNTDRPRVEISIRETTRLASQYKDHPERQVRKYVVRAFERLNLPYRIVCDLPPVDVGAAPDTSKSDQLSAFSDLIQADDPVPGVCKDSNLVLTDRGGGGLSYGRMKAAVGPAGTLDQQYEMREWVGSDDPRHCVFGCLHEIGHNMHDRSGHSNGWGRTRIEGDNAFWYRTPLAPKDDHNACGEWNPAQPSGAEQRDCLYYADCARETMLIRPDGYLDA